MKKKCLLNVNQGASQKLYRRFFEGYNMYTTTTKVLYLSEIPKYC